MGIYKERLSQSALVAAMGTVSEAEAQQVRAWLDERGLTFDTGPDDAGDLTDAQILEQARMYIAAVRIAFDFGCDAIGIQYQQGLKDTTPASDLVEGLLNNVERPPVQHPDSGAELYAGRALPHFNEVDEGAAVDGLVTNRVWNALGFDPANTLHDLRWGEHYRGDGVDDFVWVFLISGAAPASHFVGGYAGARSERQPSMYFPKGGGTLKGVSKPGEIVWSRIFVMDGALHCDLGRATVVELPLEETERRWQATTPQWPIMHAVLHGSVARPDDGAAQGQPHPGGLRPRCGGGGSGAGGQGGHAGGDGGNGSSLWLGWGRLGCVPNAYSRSDPRGYLASAYKPPH